MAVWQYDLFLIGEGNVRPFLTDDWVVFGSEQGSRIDLMFDGEDEVAIRLRLNASATGSELDAVCAFVSEVGGRLLDTTTGALLQPDLRSVAAALATSRAAAFSRSPRSFLPRLSRN